MSDDITQRQYFYDLLKQRFDHTAPWRRIEMDLTLLCADIPEPLTPESKTKFIAAIQAVKQFLLNAEIDAADLTFLDEEIERHTHTAQIALYEEKDDYVDKDTLKRFCHLSYTKEGIIGISKPYNYGQLRRVTNEVYKTTGNIKFFIGTETNMHGKVVAEIFEFKQEIAIARLLGAKNPDFPNIIALFGDPVDRNKYVPIREITAPFHIYTFVDNALREYVLLSVDEIALGDYEITGTLVKVADPKKLSESSRLPTKQPFIFLHTAKGSVVKYQTDQAFFRAVKELNIYKKDFFNFPFVFSLRNADENNTSDKETVEVVGKHPKWFKWLIWAWLCHSPQGMGERWPLPLIIIGPPNSGKTFLLERLGKIGLENQLIFKGEDSGIKGTVPSFHHTPPKRGYLCDCRRFALLDEFFRCLVNINDAEERREALARLNSILEHKKCAFSSGKGSIRVQMSARALFTNNPPRGVNGIDDVLEHFDKAFLTRTLIYWQKDNSEHAQMVRQCKLSDLRPYECKLTPEDFVGFIDYLHTTKSKWNVQQLDEIYRKPIPLLSELQRNHYEARHKHHIECLLDGIIKARRLIEAKSNFVAEPEDYALLDEIWSNIIRGWIDSDSVRALPPHERAHYLPEPSQWLWQQLKEANRVLRRQEVEEIGSKGLAKDEFITAYTILRSNGLVNDDDGSIRPYYLVPGYTHEKEIVVVQRKWSDDE